MVTLVPALIILGSGLDPTWALVISQVVLSFGIPFAVIPLGRLTRDRALMGSFADSGVLRTVAIAIATVVVVLNIALIVLTVTGTG